jgi:serine/threonine protein kinase
MALQTGARLGAYEVLSLIGAGGMGEVYRARDTRLDRGVALKILAPALAPDDHFRARFTREAHAVSALNHPHICTLYDVGRQDDIDYLVLELLEGETLATSLRHGPLPFSDVLRYGVEIADALEEAHRHGIVHRDLKPGNILLTRGGTKLLDFGLAKAIPTVSPAGDALTTTSGVPTAAGMIVGTPQYMAPEQITGAPPDARTDIFALGALLHEMTTGRRAFEAATEQGLAAKILASETPPVSMLAPGTPPAFDYLVRGCLAKEPGDRWQAAHDVKLQLQWIRTQDPRQNAAAPSAPARRRWMSWGAAALATGLSLTTMLLLSSRGAPVERSPARFEIPLPSHIRLNTWDRGEISPDGRHIVVMASVHGRPELIIRDLDSLQVSERDDTENASAPFWSPDSQSIGFFAGGKLKRIALTGGPATLLADTKEFTGQRGGATWAGGVILFPSSDGDILQVADTGGTATVVATLPRAAGKQFGWPRFLPDGRRFLVTQITDPALYVASLDTPGTHKLPQEGGEAVFAAGHLLYFRGVGVYARPFDTARLEFTGREVLIAERTSFLSASNSGTVLYRAERPAASRLTWFDRRGAPTATVGDAGPYQQLVLGPSGKRAAVVQLYTGSEGSAGDLMDVDLTTGIFSRLTTNPAFDTDPSWSPDERRVAFTSNRTGAGAIYLKDLITGKEEALVVMKETVNVDQWTPDGKFVVFRNAGRSVWSIDVGGDRTPHVLVDDTAYIEDEVHVSPDGRWAAYNADESGRWEVYVAQFPAFTATRRISVNGGVQPQWSGNGRELFYLTLDGSLMAVSVHPGTGPIVNQQSMLFRTPFDRTPQQPQYAVAADGARILGLAQVSDDRSTLTVLMHGLTASSAASAR